MDHPTNDGGSVADLIAQLGRITLERDLARAELAAAIEVAVEHIFVDAPLSDEQRRARFAGAVEQRLREKTNFLDA